MPTEPVSVLFVITRGDSIGGAQIHVRDLARGAAARGRRVAVAVGSAGPFVDLLRREGLETFAVPALGRSINPWADLTAVRQLRAVIRLWKPGLVACHTAKAGLVGRLAAWISGIPSQYTVHGWQFAEGISPVQRFLVLTVERLLAGLTRTIVTVSDYDRQLALQARVGRPDRVVTIHNGMPAAATPEGPRGGATVRLIMVARFQPQKDHATLFAALERLEELPWSLHLVGDGPEEARWKDWAAHRGWSSRVVFHGLSHQVAELLAVSEVFVLASRWEGFPNSILEAMRAALPVVATGVGGVAEAVDDGVTGAVVPAGDPVALAAALAGLIADRDRRLAWGRAGRERFQRLFTFDTMLDRIEAVWDGR